MPTLWDPPNRHALPTPNETKLVEESIELLEVQLHSAMAALMQAQLAVVVLQRQIDERRAWIAPVRRLPHDILSIIFLEVCKEGEWWAPLDLAEVCQVWRVSMLATPKAWSHLSLRAVESPELRCLYFTRSTPCRLHISLPRELDPQTASLIEAVTERIQCLNLWKPQFLALEACRFPRLERIRIYGQASDSIKGVTDTGFMLDSDLFPRLRTLGAHDLLDTISWRTPPFANVVPLQELQVTPSKPRAWSKILKYLCEHFTSLCVGLGCIEGYSPVSKPQTISFPQLFHLRIYDLSSQALVPWGINARTPRLQTYNEDVMHVGYTGPVYKGTSTVVALEFLGAIDVSLFPSVRQIEPAPWRLLDTVGQLCHNPAACPNLELIVDTELVIADELAQAKEMIEIRNALTGRTIRFGPKMQHSVFTYPGIEFNCGKWMPCYHGT